MHPSIHPSSRRANERTNERTNECRICNCKTVKPDADRRRRRRREQRTDACTRVRTYVRTSSCCCCCCCKRSYLCFLAAPLTVGEHVYYTNNCTMHACMHACKRRTKSKGMFAKKKYLSVCLLAENAIRKPYLKRNVGQTYRQMNHAGFRS